MVSRSVPLDGELKAENSNFSNIFFDKPNITKFMFVQFFPLVSCVFFFFSFFFFLGGGVQLWGPFYCGLKNTNSAACCDV